MSGRLRKLTQIYLWVIPVIIMCIVATSFFLAGIAMKIFEAADTKEPIKFQVYDGPDIYSSLTAEMMTKGFASDFKETKHYYFVYDDQLLPYIVEIHGDLTEDQLNVQSYLYDESDETPEPVIFYGMSAPIEDDVRKYAIESYNEMWGEELVTEANFSDYFGEYYLDTTKKPVFHQVKIVNILYLCSFLFAVVSIFILITGLTGRKFKISRETLKYYSEDRLISLDSQLSQVTTVNYEKEGLYLTNDLIVTDAEGFEIIKYWDVIRVYDTIIGRKRKLIAETRDHKSHILAVVKRSGLNEENQISDMKSRIHQKIEEKQEELYREPFSDAFSNILGSASEQIAVTVEPKKENVFLGILGAFLGSLIGVAFWVFVGQIGFIAGIAGFIMLKLALSGYQKFAGTLGKRGAILCLFITAGMITGACCLDYAFSMARAYFKYEASFETLSYVFLNFRKLMTEMEMWSGFFVDLAIGLAFSVWSSAGAVKEIIRLQRNQEI